VLLIDLHQSTYDLLIALYNTQNCNWWSCHGLQPNQQTSNGYLTGEV